MNLTAFNLFLLELCERPVCLYTICQRSESLSYVDNFLEVLTGWPLRVISKCFPQRNIFLRSAKTFWNVSRSFEQFRQSVRLHLLWLINIIWELKNIHIKSLGFQHCGSCPSTQLQDLSNSAYLNCSEITLGLLPSSNIPSKTANKWSPTCKNISILYL